MTWERRRDLVTIITMLALLLSGVLATLNATGVGTSPSQQTGERSQL